MSVHWLVVFRSLGLKKGDTVALMLSNRPEFHVADLATMVLGATSVSLYQTLPANQIKHVIIDSDAKVAIIEENYREVFLSATAEVSDLEHIIMVDGSQGEEGESGRKRES